MSIRDTGAFRALDEGTKPGRWQFLLTLLVVGLLADHLGLWDFAGWEAEHVGTIWQEIMKHAKDLTGLLLAIAALVSAWRGGKSP